MVAGIAAATAVTFPAPPTIQGHEKAKIRTQTAWTIQQTD